MPTTSAKTKAKPTRPTSKKIGGKAGKADKKGGKRCKAVVYEDVQDPWKQFKSPYGGSMSPVEQLARIRKGLLGKEIVLGRDKIAKSEFVLDTKLLHEIWKTAHEESDV